jgi:hypothetical protein
MSLVYIVECQWLFSSSDVIGVVRRMSVVQFGEYHWFSSSNGIDLVRLMALV